MELQEHAGTRNGQATRQAPRLFVGSEVGTLRRVLLHRPGRELTRLTPANREELLFDDVLWVKRARQEHDAFADTLVERGVEVFYLQDLLTEVLAEDAVRAELVERTFEGPLVAQRLTGPAREWIAQLSSSELASWLIGGIAWQDLPFELEGLAAQLGGTRRFRGAATPQPLLHT